MRSTVMINCENSKKKKEVQKRGVNHKLTLRFFMELLLKTALRQRICFTLFHTRRPSLVSLRFS